MISILAWLGLALLTENTLSITPLKVYSIAGAVAAAVFALWDHLLWHLTPVRYFTGVPFIARTWRGELHSSYYSDLHSNAIPIALYISQSASSVGVTLFTKESESISENASLICDADGRYRLTWLYTNTPRPAVRTRNDRHRGAAEVYVGTAISEGLQGTYFTDRRTGGELTLTEWSPRRYGTAASALAGIDFRPPRPFAKES